MTTFPHLFSPVHVGSVTIKNRIVSSGHDTVMAEAGAIGGEGRGIGCFGRGGAGDAGDARARFHDE